MKVAIMMMMMMMMMIMMKLVSIMVMMMNYDGYNSDDFYESDDYKVIIVLCRFDEMITMALRNKTVF